MGRLRRTLGRQKRRVLVAVGRGPGHDPVASRQAEYRRRRTFGEADIAMLFDLASSADQVVTCQEANTRRATLSPHTLILRHDIDNDLENAVVMARREAAAGIRASYFPLHTEWYYRWDSGKKLSKLLLRALDEIASLGHEIGLHNNAVAAALQTGEEPIKILDRELSELRRHGFDVVGTCAHGDPLCRAGGFVNSEIFAELPRPNLGAPDREISVADPASGRVLKTKLQPVPMSELGLRYEAGWIGHTLYMSDVGGRWSQSPQRLVADLETLGGPTQVLTHPVYWALSGEAVSPLPPRLEVREIAPRKRSETRLSKIIVRGDCCSRRAIHLNQDLFGRSPTIVSDEKSRTDFLLDHLAYGSATPDDIRRYLNVPAMNASLQHYVIHQTDRATLEATDADLLVMDNYADMNFQAWRHKRHGWKIWPRLDHLLDRDAFYRDFEPVEFLSFQQSVDNHVALIEFFRAQNGPIPVLFLDQPTAFYPKLDGRSEFHGLGRELERLLPDVFAGSVGDEHLQPDDMDSCGPGQTLHFQRATYRQMIEVAQEKGLQRWLD